MKRLVRLVGIIHDATVLNTGRKDRRTDLEIKQPYAVFQYSIFMKGIDRADQYLSYYSVLRRTVQWLNVSAELCTLQCTFGPYCTFSMTIPFLCLLFIEIRDFDIKCI
jgi:hypothetical protein